MSSLPTPSAVLTTSAPFSSSVPFPNEARREPWWKAVVVAIALALITVPFVVPLLGVVEAPIGPGVWSLVILSGMLNLIVISYHYAVPAHPKFLMIPWRKAVLRTHIISGSTELVAGLIACFGSHETPWAGRIMALAALCGHIPSATLQTPIVFGAKAVMTPGYILCIALHAFCALNLLVYPTSTLWAVNTFLIFNIYVWCRIYFYVFDGLKLFASEKYTISILAAGMTVVPAVLGPMTFMALVAFICIYIVLYRKLYITSPSQYNEFVRERARGAAISPEMLALWESNADPAEEEKICKRYFTILDVDKNGTLEGEEIDNALGAANLPAAVVDTFLRDRIGSKSISYPAFREHVWAIDAIRRRARRIVATNDATSERDRAELVFKQLDIDRNGLLGPAELRVLLLEWGCPESEARRYIRRVDSDGDGMINFDDFYAKMRSVWRFIYYEVYQAESAQEETDMLQRFATSFKESMLVRRQKRTVQEELLSRVPFLQNASEKLVHELAESLVREAVKADGVVFSEGSPGERFYLIETGSVRILKGNDVITTLAAGACFGEGALISDEPRAATVAAATDAVLHSLSRASFEFIVQRYPEVRAELMRLHKTRVASAIKRSMTSDLLGRVVFLKAASEQVIDDLAASLEPRTLTAGTTLIREGDEGDRFFLLERGSVRVSKDGHLISDLGPGSCFGEGALISNQRRTASVIANEDSRVLTLTRDTFQQILAKHPGVYDEITRLHAARQGNN